jgi:hypothetical protein
MMDLCETMACFGGSSGKCNHWVDDLWGGRGVKCAGHYDNPDQPLMLIVGKKNLDGTWTLTYDGQPEIFVNRIKTEEANYAYEDEDRFCLMCNKGYWPSGIVPGGGHLSNLCTNG